MSVVANVAINVDAANAIQQLNRVKTASSSVSASFDQIENRAKAVKAAVEAQQGSFAKASTVQGVFSANVKNTEAAMLAQIAALRDVQKNVQFNGALYQKAGAQIKEYQDKIKAASSATAEVGPAASGAATGIRGIGGALQSALGPLLTVTAALSGIKKGLDTAFERGAAEQRLKNITSGAEEYNAALALAADTSQKFGLTQTESTKALADVYSRLKGVGFGLQETGQIYQGFNVIAQQSGLAGEEAAGAFFQLSQALGKGKLNGDEFVIVAERMPQLLDAIAQTTGKSRGELQQMAQDGKITSDVLYQALSGAAAASGDLGSKLTAQQSAFNALRQASDELFNSIGKAFAPAVIAGAELLTQALAAIQEQMPVIVAAANQLLAPFIAIGSVVLPAVNAGFQGVLSNIQPIIQTAAFFGTFIGILKGITLATQAWAAATTALATAKRVAATAAAALQAIMNPANLVKVGVAIAGAAAASYALGKAMDQAAGETAKTKDESAKLLGSVDQVLKKYSSLPPAVEDSKAKQKELNQEFEKTRSLMDAQGELRIKQLDNEIKIKEAAKDLTGAAELRKQKIEEEYNQRTAALRLEHEHGKISEELYKIKIQIAQEDKKSAEISEKSRQQEEQRAELAARINKIKEQEAANTKRIAEQEAASKRELEQRVQIVTKTLSMQQQTAELELSMAQTEEQKLVATNQVTVAKTKQAELEYQIAIQAEGATQSYINAAAALKNAKIESFEIAANLARSAAEAARIRNLGGAYGGTEFGGAFAVQNVALQQQGLEIWKNALKRASGPNIDPLGSQAILTEAQMQIAQLQQPYKQAQQQQKYQSAISELQNLGIARIPASVQTSPTGLAYYGSPVTPMQTPAINITTGPVMQMDNTNYVTVSDLQTATSAAAQQGANLALSQLQNNPTVRRSIGVAR